VLQIHTCCCKCAGGADGVGSASGVGSADNKAVGDTGGEGDALRLCAAAAARKRAPMMPVPT
jgi:hypothetical protein